MLKNTFQHIKGISANREHTLWESGILSWSDLKTRAKADKKLAKLNIHESFEKLDENDLSFFLETLPKKEWYRLALQFPENTLFLKIETTGKSKVYDDITVIGWVYKNRYSKIIDGENISSLSSDLNDAKVLITFDGSASDLPFLKSKLPELNFPQCHIDLRHFAKRFNLTGGQLKIEQETGFFRDEEYKHIDDKQASVLWYKYAWGDTSSAAKLVHYNQLGISGMIHIFKHVLDNFIFPNVPPELKTEYEYPSFSNYTNLSYKKLKEKYTFEDYSGEKLPKITFSNLQLKKGIKAFGIDLTGSEDKPSGICTLKGNKAETMMIGSDENILSIIDKFKPDIISIDSPLGLPDGRVSVFDDDPGREEFGITRECDREMKSRGVNIYPTLIPSMQSLTKRGISLAENLRAKGYTVIESYPGGAQDIIGIPRKGASEEFLKKGLKAFGIEGSYIVDSVKHDELDAITSAIVGLFFCSGDYEALGNESEGYLIIPKISKVKKRARAPAHKSI